MAMLYPRITGSDAYGYLSVNFTVDGSTTVVRAIADTTPAIPALTFGFSTVSIVNFTSSAPNGWPSCHFTPGRSRNVYSVRVGLALQESARSGTTRMAPLRSSYLTSVLKIVLSTRMSTSFPGIVIGYAVGLPGIAIRHTPPRFPTGAAPHARPRRPESGPRPAAAAPAMRSSSRRDRPFRARRE